MLTQALTYAQTNQQQNLDGLLELLKIPSISTLPAALPDINRAAEWLQAKLTAIGLENAEILPTAGKPVVYADWLHAGPDAPTLIIYGHYDVQPADPLDEWETPPFKPTLKGDDVFCRGASDNKGQFYAHIGAVAAYLQSSKRLPLNVKFLLEGEEEMGSPHLEAFLNEQAERYQADVAVISDTHMLDAQTPALITSVRGLVYMEISMRGSKRDLHSGIYGGVVENPINAMARLLAALRDEQGHVTIPGFYDRVKLLTPLEKEALQKTGKSAEKFLAETGAPALFGEPDFSPAERVSARPTLDVHGIRGGFVDEGQKTVIPATASAKVSMRLVAEQDADEIAELFTRHVQALAPATMETEVKTMAASPAAAVDMTAPAIEAAAQAFERGFGRRPVFLQEGGSIPVVGMFAQQLGLPVAMMGLGLPDDGLHSPNEKFHLPNFYRGIETMIHFYELLSN